MNSSYVSWVAALDLLKNSRSLKRWIILSGVSDLETGSHDKLRLLARDMFHAADYVVLMGIQAAELHRRLLAQGFSSERIFTFKTCQDAAPWIAERLTMEDIALLRGHATHHLQ